MTCNMLLMKLETELNKTKRGRIWPLKPTFYLLIYMMKTKQLKNNVLQVFCKNLQQQLQALVMYPNYLFEIKGENWETFLYFKIK